MTRAPFITFEGGDGAGKSTQLRLLRDRLHALGRPVLATREPGGAPGAERIRGLLVEGDAAAWTPTAEALLMYAARAEHLQRTINPAREAGTVVLCDRFADSTFAYQAAAGGVAAAFVNDLYRHVVAQDGPDLTLIFDLPSDQGLARVAAAGRSGEDRFERKGAAFQARVRDAFLSIAAAEPHRCVVIDAARSADAVADAVWRTAARVLGPEGAGS